MVGIYGAIKYVHGSLSVFFIKKNHPALFGKDPGMARAF
jgi:hypothetical protein